MHFSQLHTYISQSNSIAQSPQPHLSWKKLTPFWKYSIISGFFTNVEKGNPLIYFFINSAVYFFHSGSTQLVLETEPGPGALETK